jgi:hypothetical protein
MKQMRPPVERPRTVTKIWSQFDELGSQIRIKRKCTYIPMNLLFNLLLRATYGKNSVHYWKIFLYISAEMEIHKIEN